jgi:hypothetical protein
MSILKKLSSVFFGGKANITPSYTEEQLQQFKIARELRFNTCIAIDACNEKMNLHLLEQFLLEELAGRKLTIDSLLDVIESEYFDPKALQWEVVKKEADFYKQHCNKNMTDELSIFLQACALTAKTNYDAFNCEHSRLFSVLNENNMNYVNYQVSPQDLLKYAETKLLPFEANKNSYTGAALK